MKIWVGRSLFTGTHIAVYLTGYKKPSANTKTGPVAQSWILSLRDTPTKVVAAGTDSDICGRCIHRQSPRTCYVSVFRAPQQVYHAHRKQYPDTDIPKINPYIKSLRIGAYGDPASVPFEVWRDLTGMFKSWTGYTHAWRSCDQQIGRAHV